MEGSGGRRGHKPLGPQKTAVLPVIEGFLPPARRGSCTKSPDRRGAHRARGEPTATKKRQGAKPTGRAAANEEQRNQRQEGVAADTAWWEEVTGGGGGGHPSKKKRTPCISGKKTKKSDTRNARYHTTNSTKSREKHNKRSSVSQCPAALQHSQEP